MSTRGDHLDRSIGTGMPIVTATLGRQAHIVGYEPQPQPIAVPVPSKPPMVAHKSGRPANFYQVHRDGLPRFERDRRLRRLLSEPHMIRAAGADAEIQVRTGEAFESRSFSVLVT